MRWARAEGMDRAGVHIPLKHPRQERGRELERARAFHLTTRILKQQPGTLGQTAHEKLRCLCWVRPEFLGLPQLDGVGGGVRVTAGQKPRWGKC